MIKFLILCVTFLSMYLGFSIISQYDTAVSITLWDNQIDTTLFALVAVFLIAQLVCTVVLKLVLTILAIPSLVGTTLKKRKLDKVNETLLQVVASLLINDKRHAAKNMSWVIPEIRQKNSDIADLMAAEVENDDNFKMQYYRNIMNHSYLGAYATKKLAQVLHNNGSAIQAEEIASKASDIDGPHYS